MLLRNKFFQDGLWSYPYFNLPSYFYSSQFPFSVLEDTKWIDNRERYILSIDIPGVSRNNISIHLEENVIYIEASETFSDDRTETVREYKKQFQVPQNSDKDNITVTLENGVLNIYIPKKVDKHRKQISLSEEES